MRISDWGADVCSADRAARVHARGPPLRRALALALADLGRLRRHRHIGEHADPQLADALHVTRDGAPRGLDLTRRQAAGSEGLQAIGAKVQLGAALRSEEHTSELQSLMRISYAVFCLKKKTTQ